MGNWKFRLKRIVAVMIILLATVPLSSCGERIKDFVGSDLQAALSQRIDDNEKILADMLKMGFVSQQTYETGIKNMDKIRENYRDNVAKINEDGDSPLIRGMAHVRALNGLVLRKYGVDTIKNDKGEDYRVWWTNPSGTIGFHPSTDGTMQSVCIVNYLGISKKKWSLSVDDGDLKACRECVVDEDVVEPLVLISKKISDEISKNMATPVYVLRPDAFSRDGAQTIDGMNAMLKQAISEVSSTGKRRVDFSLLNNYFEKAKNAKGEDILFLDLSNELNNLVVISKEQDLDGDKKEPGYDLIISQYETPTFTLRFSEFSQENYDHIKDTLLMNDGSYLFLTEGDTKGVFLMEYPVSYIQSFEDIGNKKAKGNLATSGLGINLYTGEMIKYKATSGGKWSTSGEKIEIDGDNAYLNIAGADNEQQEGRSSFIVKGVTAYTLTRSDENANKNKTSSFYCGRIILRDYLEATYAPGYDSGEKVNLKVFGRKLRINFDEWEEEKNFKSTKLTQYTPIWYVGPEMAYFVDKDGIKVPQSPELCLNDFCAYKILNTAKPYISRLKGRGEADKKVASSDLKPAEKVKDIGDLPELNTKKQIAVSTCFPFKEIGQADYASDTTKKQRFYVMATTGGLFNTGLFSGWIESASSTASLDWWNEYLVDNGFVYDVSHESINEYLMGNFPYQLSQNGVVILDLETIAKIQDMYKKEDNLDSVASIRTTFIVLGWTLIIGSLILMLLWVIDTNTDIGLDLLQKVTLGHWIAVKYESDIPSHNTNGFSYVTFSKLITKVLVVITMGIILIQANIFVIVSKLISIFGQAGVYIESVIKGIIG